MEEIERTNVEIVCLNQQVVFVSQNPYMIDVDKGRNCYSCERFGYLIQNCRRWGIVG